jgi:hypothetical protein
MLILAQISPEFNPCEKMNPLDDHELLRQCLRAGLTHAEVRQTVRRGLDAGDLSWPGASETAAWRQDRIYVDMEAIQVVKGVGHSPLELLEWPTALIEGFQACDIVEGQRNLPVEVGDAS